MDGTFPQHSSYLMVISAVHDNAVLCVVLNIFIKD